MNSRNEHYNTQRLREIPITEVARRLGDTLHRKGASHMTLCPWHDDHHPSLSLVEGTGRNYCHCFSCDQGGDVIAYVMQHQSWTFQEACQWLSAEFCISTLAIPSAPRPKPRPRTGTVKAEPQYTYIPIAMADGLLSTESSLCRCLMRMFRPEAVEWLVGEYLIGCYAMNGLDDYTVFPSIDSQGRVCNLKVQHYETDPTSPRFCHSDQTAYWLGKMWARQGRLPADAQFRSDCLFGEHLLPRYPDSVVALVESPKNALFGCLSQPQLLWVATGSKGMLKREVLQPLRGRDVIVIPDCDAVDEWAQTLKAMADLANFTVSDFCRRMAPEGQPKFDIADHLQQLSLTAH